MMQQLPHFPENHSTSAAMASADMTVPEWQRARLMWLQQQQQQQQQQYCYQSFFTGATPTALDLCRPNSSTFSVLPAGTAAFDTCCNAFCDEEGSSVADDLLISNMPPDLIHCPIFGSSFVSGSVDVEGTGDEPGMSRFSCPPAVGVVLEADQIIKATVLLPSVSTASPFGVRGGAAVAAAAPYQSTVDRGSWESWRKRKADHEAIAEEPEDDGCRVEKVEGTADGYCYLDAMIVPKLETDPPISSVDVTTTTTTTTTTANGSDGGKPATGTNKAASTGGGTSRDKCTKVPDPAAKTGYIHVRARRGQATDSHSLAERARREKISKRMKLLQDLVPGCSTITGKAGVLDEIINYVQCLQRQVEFLSMKLAAANPLILDSDIDAFLSKEVIMQMVLPHDGAGVLPCSPAGSTPPPDVSSFLNHVNSTIMQTQQAVAAPTAVQYCSSTTSHNGVQAVSSSCPGELQDSLLLHPTPRAPPRPVAELSEGCLQVVDPAYNKVRVTTSLPSWEADHLHGQYYRV